MNRYSRKNGFSLLEIMVASVIFLIAATGLLMPLRGGQLSSDTSQRRLVAANYGRQLLEDYRAKVDQGIWNSSWLTCDGTSQNWPSGQGGINPLVAPPWNGTAKYTCIPVQVGTETQALRKVNLTISWTEPSS